MLDCAFSAMETFLQDKLHQKGNFHPKPVVRLSKHNALLNHNRDGNAFEFSWKYDCFSRKIGQIHKNYNFPDIEAELDEVFNHLLFPDLPFLHLKAKQIKAEKVLIKMWSHIGDESRYLKKHTEVSLMNQNPHSTCSLSVTHTPYLLKVQPGSLSPSYSQGIMLIKKW